MHRQRSGICTAHHAPQEHALAVYLQRCPDLMRTADSNTSSTAADPVTTHTPLTPALIHSSLHSTHRQRSTTCTAHHAPQEYALAAYLQRRLDLMLIADSNTSAHCRRSSHHTHSLTPALIHSSLHSTHRQRSATCTAHHAPQEHALMAYLQRRPDLIRTADSNSSDHCCRCGYVRSRATPTRCVPSASADNA